MCGIIAIYSEKHKTCEDKLKYSIDQLTHRGPDNQQYWMSPDYE